MFYQEYRPSAPLAPYVQCYWTLRAPANPFPATERLIPDGRIELIFSFAGPYRRHLERTFLAVVGVTPKSFSRIVRFLAVLERVRRADATGWSDAAYACGYADQAHLIKDFTVFTGLSPARYAAQPNRIAAMLTGGPLSHSSKGL